MEACRLMADISFSTIAVEQGHGSLAVVHRSHPRYGEFLLAVRSFLHAVRSLFRDPQIPVKLKRLETERARLEKKNPNKLNGASLLAGAAAGNAMAALPGGLRRRRRGKL